MARTTPKPARKSVTFVEGAYREHAPNLRRYIARFERRKEDAEDVVQETFVRLEAVREPGDIRDMPSFLKKIAFRLIGARRDYNRRRPTVYDSDLVDQLDQSGHTVARDTALDNLIAKELLDLAIASLPPNQREAVVCVRKLGMSHEEAAAQLGISVASLQKRLYEAYETLDKFRRDAARNEP